MGGADDDDASGGGSMPHPPKMAEAVKNMIDKAMVAVGPATGGGAGAGGATTGSTSGAVAPARRPHHHVVVRPSAARLRGRLRMPTLLDLAAVVEAPPSLSKTRHQRSRTQPTLCQASAARFR